jgi:hypothetical protein
MGFRVIKDRDTGFNAFFQGIRQLGSMRVKVGVQGREAAQVRPGGLTMVGLATIHEFGAPTANIPQRSFLRSTADANRGTYARVLEGAVKKLVKKPQAFKAKAELFRLGERVRADVIKRIKAGIPPPNTPATIAGKKGENVPLIDTGQLISSITSVVK